MTVGFGPWDVPRRILRLFAESSVPKAPSAGSGVPR
jgi:hypothetical protein